MRAVRACNCSVCGVRNAATNCAVTTDASRHRDYADEKFDRANTTARYAQLLYGNAAGSMPSIAGKGGWIEQNSNGLFGFRNAGIIGPLTFEDVGATRELNESTYDCLRVARDGCQNNPTKPGYNIPNSFNRVVEMADASGFDFAAYDKNGDGVVTNQELAILWIEADAYGYDTRTSTRASEPGYRRSTKIGYVRSTPSPEHTALYEWYSLFRSDHLLSTDPRFNPNNFAQRALNARKGYRFLKIAGYIRTEPELGTSKPTVVEFSRYFSEVNDNSLTATVSYPRQDERSYRRRRIEGFVYNIDEPQPADTVPLYVHESRNPIALPGLTRQADVVLPNGIRVSMPIATGSENSPMSNYTHELMHVLGVSWDVYGSIGLNRRYTIMGPMLGNPRQFLSTHLDGYTKLLFGWIKPKLIEQRTRRIQTLAPVAETLIATDNNRRASAAIFYSRERRDEFFLVENRQRFATNTGINYDGDATGSGRMARDDDGLAIWHYKTRPKRRLGPVWVQPVYRGQDTRPGARSDRAMYLIPPTLTRGRTIDESLWTTSSGSAKLTWLDGFPGPRLSVLQARAPRDLAVNNRGLWNPGTSNHDDSTRRSGQSYKTEVVISGSAAVCERRCALDYRCEAWNFEKSRITPSSPRQPICSYFGAGSLPVADAKATSGSKNGLLPGTDLPGAQLTGVQILDIADPRLCEVQCAENAQCKAWTFVSRFKGCYLKKSVPATTRDDCCTSGIK